MNDEEYDGDDEDRMLDEMRRARAIWEDRLQRWTRLVAFDGNLTVHCLVGNITMMLRKIATDDEAKSMNISRGSHVVMVETSGLRIPISTHATAAEAENAIEEFLAVRGIGQDHTVG